MFISMASMSKLHMIHLVDCWLEARRSSFATLPRSGSMTNLILDRLGDSDRGELMATCLFPNLKTLIMLADYRSACGLLHTDFPATCNPFRTVQRLHIENIEPEDVSCLSNCLREAATSGNLRLTHLKIAQRPHYVLRQQELLDLVSALRGAPLEVLSMCGLAYVGEQLFVALAEAVPDISVLTLAYRQNAGQDPVKFSRWPEPSYQYAGYLAALPRLQTFVWNFCLEPFPCYFPSEFPVFASCAIDHSSMDSEDQCEEPYDDIHWDDKTWYKEWECLAKLFSVHVPTLLSLVILQGSMPIVNIISRETGDNIHIKTHFATNHSVDHVRQVDPSPFFSQSHPWLYTSTSQAVDAERGSAS